MNFTSTSLTCCTLFLAPCTEIRAPQNGNGYIQTSSGNKHGAVIVFKCKQGYTILGSATVICNNGSWNDRVPVCYKTS